MAKILDFNLLQQPTQVLQMADDDKTVIHVSAPTVDLVDELKNNGAALEKALSSNSPYTSRLVYGLAARLINCNLDGITVTAEELAVKYRMSLAALKLFFETYVEFLNEITDSKN
jgi:hypothetical protein